MNTSVQGAAKPATIVRSQAGLEWRLMMANGEQILLTLIIPVVLLVGLSLTEFVSLDADTRIGRLDILVPGVLALAVMSSAFTALAISTGFDRRSEAIKFLGTTPLSRTGLLMAKTIAVLGVLVVQLAVILVTAFLLGWRAEGTALLSIPLIVLGTLTFTALGLALAGVLRAEATLAAANAVYVLLLLGGGVIVPSSDFPEPWNDLVGVLPSAALADGLRQTMSTSLDAATLLGCGVVLLVWAIIGSFIVRKWFKWTS